jgi:hypothetical protein
MVEEALYNYTVSDTSVSAIYGQQQRNASQIVQGRFAKGRLTNNLPDALHSLGECLDISVTCAGKLSYLLWHFNPIVKLPNEAIDPLRVILFDREFSRSPGASNRHWTALLGLSRTGQDKASDITGRFYPI